MLGLSIKSPPLLWTLSLIFLFACGKEQPPDSKPVVVKTQKVIFNEQASDSVYPGLVRGRYESRLGFQVGGKTNARHVNLGDRVRSGDVLLEIDPKDIKESVRMAEAQVEAASSEYTLAQAEHRRYKNLYQNKVISKSLYDQYKTSLDAREQALSQAKAQLNQRRNELGYTRLRADADGVIANIEVEVGQVVSAGLPVVTLIRTAALEVEINVPENKISQVSLKQEVEVSFWALSGKTNGLVREIAPAADQTARTYSVRINLLAPPAKMRLGMTSTVRIAPDSGSKPNVSLPISAIYQTGDQSYVWLVKDRKLTLTPVNTNGFYGNQIIIDKGLNQGDLVVVAGVHKLFEGQEVRLLSETW